MDNQSPNGVSFDQAHKIAIVEAAQHQQQLQLAATSMNPFGPANFLGVGALHNQGGPSAARTETNLQVNDGTDSTQGSGGDYHDRIQLFQRQVEEQSKLISQLKGSLVGAAEGGANNFTYEIIRRQLLQLQQSQGQGQGQGA